MSKVPVKSLIYKGKHINYKTIFDVKRQLNITKDEAKRIVNKYGKTIKLKGAIIKYNRPTDLTKRLNISPQDIADVITNQNDGIRILYDPIEHTVAKYNVKDRPFIFRKFGVKRNIKMSEYVSRLTTIKDTTNKIYKTAEALSSTTMVRITVDITVYFLDYNYNLNGADPSTVPIGEWEKRKMFGEVFNTKVEDVEEEIQQRVDNFLLFLQGNLLSQRHTYVIRDNYSNKTFKIVNNLMMKALPLKIYGLDLPDFKEGSCVSSLLKNKYKKISPSKIDILFSNGATPIDLIEKFSKPYNIKTIIYDINLKEQISYIPLKPSKNHATLLAINYNNHIYEIHDTLLKKKSYKNYDNVNIRKDIKKSLLKLLKLGILPTDIRVYEGEIYSFIHNNLKYIENVEYRECMEILKLFGLEDHLYDSIKIKNLGRVIEKLYKKDINCNSFFPVADRFIKGGYNYINDDLVDKEHITIDKNKDYSYCLKNLSFIISLDYRTSDIIDNVTEIVDHYLYIAKPNRSSILLPDTNLYSGEFLKYCKSQGLSYKILSGITTTKHYNYFYDMVKDCYEKLDKETFKKVFNIMIGTFEPAIKRSTIHSFNRICNKEEAECISGFKRQISDDYYLIYDTHEDINIYNKKPIAVQIKDNSRKLLYEKLLELNITDNEIVQIKTDAITILKPQDTYDDYFINDSLDGWKYEKFTALSTNPVFYNSKLDFHYDMYNENIIYDCYAGCGKTYDIINNLTPNLKDYIVLSPTHSSLTEHKEANNNNCIMQKYSFSNTIPKENTIIIDEHGLMNKSCHDLIFKCHLLGKTIISYGDYKQLPPPADIKRDKKHYIDMLFRQKSIMSTNYRNDFNKEYYDNILNGSLNGLEEVKKYSSNDYKNVEAVICYRVETCDKYNKLIMTERNIKFGDVGTKVLCKSNELKNKNVYNGYLGTITSSNEEQIIIDNEIIITPIQFTKYFKPAYARTIYNVQGKSLDSYYYAPDDYSFIDQTNTDRAYTVVSRLKTKN